MRTTSARWLEHYPTSTPSLIGFFLDERPAFDKEQFVAARKVRDCAVKPLPGGVMSPNVGRANGATVLTHDRPNGVVLLREAPEEDNLRDRFARPAWADEKAKGAHVFPRHRFAALVHSKPGSCDSPTPTAERDARRPVLRHRPRPAPVGRVARIPVQVTQGRKDAEHREEVVRGANGDGGVSGVRASAR